MTFTRRLLTSCLASLLFCSFLDAQQPSSPSSAAVVPRLVNFPGRAMDAQGKPISGVAGVTFAIYKDQYDGAPLWLETQNVQTDVKGNYTVQLGASKSEGLPLDLFSTGEARWLGVRVNGGEEQPRVLLLSVPYALKAADAETIGGLPPSAFVLAAPPATITSATNAASQAETAHRRSQAQHPSLPPARCDDGAVQCQGRRHQSQIFDNGSNVVIGNTAPRRVGCQRHRHLSRCAEHARDGRSDCDRRQEIAASQLTASAFNSGTAAAVNQTFRWQAKVA